jgi:hypothetical protein
VGERGGEREREREGGREGRKRENMIGIIFLKISVYKETAKNAYKYGYKQLEYTHALRGVFPYYMHTCQETTKGEAELRKRYHYFLPLTPPLSFPPPSLHSQVN